MLNAMLLKEVFKEKKISRTNAINSSIQRKIDLSEKMPEIAKIDSQLSSIGASIAKVFYSSDPQLTIDDLSRKSQSLQERRKQILTSAGYDKDYLEPHFSCTDCNDTGRVEGKICHCVKDEVVKKEIEALERIAPVDECSFGSFDLSYYKGITDENGNDVYGRTESIVKYLKAYSDDFHRTSKNIFMFGKTGLGKTHLALAVAKVVIEKKFNIVYGTASGILCALEDEKFRRISSKYSMDDVLDAELLIIDDLGAEFSTSFTTAAVHNIIESRLLAKKPTIITTNLDIDGINQKYGERITSRIIGAYEPLKFEGKDIRQLKRFQY